MVLTWLRMCHVSVPIFLSFFNILIFFESFIFKILFNFLTFFFENYLCHVSR